MKRLLSLIVVLLLAVSLSSCGKTDAPAINAKDKELIHTAIACLEETWQTDSKEYGYPTVLKIVNTRIVRIRENDNRYLEDVECIVEFDIHANYYSESELYLSRIQFKDTVVFYRNGSCETSTSLFELIRAATFSLDYLDHIESVTDYEYLFNQELRLLD